MTRISVGATVGSGFALIRRQPWAVLTWGGLEVAAAAAMVAVMWPLYAAMFAHFTNVQAGVTPSSPMIGLILSMEGAVYLLGLLGLVLRAVIMCAVFRAILRPEPDRYAYLRVGMTELFFVFATLVVYVLMMIAIVVVAAPLAIVAGVLVGLHAGAAAVILGVIGVAALMIALGYTGLRLSMAWPMIADNGKFRLFESWRMTQGNVGPLFLMVLSLLGILWLTEVVVAVILMAIFVATGGPGAVQTAAAGADFPHAFPVLLARLTPVFVTGAIIAVPVLGAFIAIVGAPFARAYMTLRDGKGAMEGMTA